MARRRQGRGVTLLGAGITLTTPRRQPPRPPQAAIGSDDGTRVLGLDLAMIHTGWCLLVGGQPAAHGVVELPPRQRRDETLAGFLGRRAEELAQQITHLIVTHRPEIVGYEYPDVPRPHWSGGSKGREFNAVQGLSRAEGFLVALWPQIGQGVRLVAVPMTVAKRKATGSVGANKDSVRWGLQTYRRWDLRGWDDNAVDAAAVALAVREAM
jgi:hypothetical protein